MFSTGKHYLSWRLLLLALPLALSMILLFPGVSQAHAILLKSDPARDAVLQTAPNQVRMWFSEDLNPITSTAAVVNSANQRIDQNKATVSSSDTREMDVTLRSSLPPGAYVVIWRTQSADDGHVLSGSFIFYVANTDGTVPRFNGTLPGQNVLGNAPASATGQLDGPTLFSLLMVTLVDLGTVFWMGGQLWHTFVLDATEENSPPATAENDPTAEIPSPVTAENYTATQREIEQGAKQRFEQRFSVPVLRGLFIANIGVLLGQAFSLTGGHLDQIFSPVLLLGLLNGRFGTFWIMREVVLALAMVLASFTSISNRRSARTESFISWSNLVLGLALLIAITLSGHAASVSGTTGIFAVLVDWLHLLAASLWVGGMLYIMLIYLPVLKGRPSIERTRSLLLTLPRFSPYALAGVIIMALSGPFNATVHMYSFDQLYTTAYGRALVVKVACVCALLLTSAIHVLHMRPQLKQDYEMYEEAREELEEQATEERTLEVKEREQSVTRQTSRLTSVLRWEPLLGVAVILCTGLLNVFAGTLLPANANLPTQNPQQARPFTGTVQTDDKKFTITLNVTPDRFGPNTFTATVKDSSGKTDTNIGVTLYTQMLDMDMGTDTLNLQPDGKGHFTGPGDLSMGGNWQIRVQIRTPDNTLHEARFKFYTYS